MFLTNSFGCRVWSCNEDGLARNTIHEDTGASLQIVKVDEAILCNEVDDAVLL
jgi:hypothetical protein